MVVIPLVLTMEKTSYFQLETSLSKYRNKLEVDRSGPEYWREIYVWMD
jgi:hypothetical protein